MIYFVRHGETDFNKFSISQGQTDTSLNKTGLEQAADVAERLKNTHLDVVFCSSLTRARQTCEAIMKYHNCPVFYDDRLKEISKGTLETYRNSKDTYDKFFANPHAFGGEDKNDIFKRAASFLEDLRKYKNKDILIVGHAGSFEYLRHLLEGNDPISAPLVKPNAENCEIRQYKF